MKYIVLLLFFSFFSCKKESVIDSEIASLNINIKDYISVDTAFYDSRKIKSLRFKKNETQYTEMSFYESGKKKSIGSVKQNQCHDKYIDWYENGKYKWVRSYSLGNQIGKSVSFRENGKFEKQYDNYTKVHTFYYKNGIPKSDYSDKIQYYYYPNGCFIEQFDKINEEEYSVKYFSENCAVVFSGNYKKKVLYKDGLKFNGKIISYFNSGKISHFEEIVNGIPEGKIYTYYGNGVLKFEGEYLNGKELISKFYHENGKIHFIRDKKNKTYTEWDEKGEIVK